MSEILISRVYQTIKEFRLLKPGETVLIGISGGPDSVALTLILKDINETYRQNWRLILAHLNHGIRGRESLRDERFVRDFGCRPPLPVYTKRIAIPKLIKLGSLHSTALGGSAPFRTGLRCRSVAVAARSFEAVARRERYNFLETIARKIKADKIVTGHTSDDQAETVLMRILRGTGLRGLRGILLARPVSPGSDITLTRPLLFTERKEILTYLKEKRQAYCVDSSNLSRDIIRNKIRLDLIPHLEKHYKAVRYNLARIGETAQEVYGYLQKQAKDELIYTQGNSILIKHFRQIPRALRVPVLDEMIKKVAGALPRLNARHYQAMLDLINASAGQQIQLPNNLTIRRENDRIMFLTKPHRVVGKISAPVINLKVPGKTPALPYNLRIEIAKLKNTPSYLKKFKAAKTQWEEIFDYDKVKLPLRVRYRRKGDKIQPLGMKGMQTLKKFFIDHKVKRGLRKKIPLVADRNRIIWVAGYRINEKVKVTEQTKNIIKIRLSAL